MKFFYFEINVVLFDDTELVIGKMFQCNQDFVLALLNVCWILVHLIIGIDINGRYQDFLLCSTVSFCG